MTSLQGPIHASAPGKVVLSGEYAVLDGAPAICMAVNRRARVTLEMNGEDYHTVVAPGHVDSQRRFSFDNGFNWLDDEADFELLECVWSAAGVETTGGLALTLDTAGFLDPRSGSKTGIGSSAALAVALAAAIAATETREVDFLDVAHRGHLDFQNGLGSGVDIATSAAGGLVVFAMPARETLQLKMPKRLECRLLWSGSPARTGKKLERYSEGPARPSRAALAYSARRIAGAWRSGKPKRILSEYRDYVQVLQEFSEDHDLGIFDAGHDELVAIAARQGLVYKPCGAGGGDIGIVLGRDAEAIDDFVAGSLPNGFRAMDLDLDPVGVKVTGGS